MRLVNVAVAVYNAEHICTLMSTPLSYLMLAAKTSLHALTIYEKETAPRAKVRPDPNFARDEKRQMRMHDEILFAVRFVVLQSLVVHVSAFQTMPTKR